MKTRLWKTAVSAVTAVVMLAAMAVPVLAGVDAYPNSEVAEWEALLPEGVTIVDAAGRTGVIQLAGGGGASAYNKMYSSLPYAGNMSLSFDVYLTTTSGDDMFFFTPRYIAPQKSNTYFEPTAQYTSYYANTVLTGATPGLRFSSWTYGDANGSTQVMDTSGLAAGRWYTMKYQIAGSVHRTKVWESGTPEPEGWNTELDCPGTAPNGYISFAKRGAGVHYLDNISVEVPDGLYITGIQSPDTVLARVGTPFGELDLPETVVAYLSDANTAILPVVWDDSSYRADELGTHTLLGEVQEGAIPNPLGIKTSIAVQLIHGNPEDMVYYNTQLWPAPAGVWKYHVFGMVTANDGSVLAFAENRTSGGDAHDPHHIVMRRSTDNGYTWEDTRILANHSEDPCTPGENGVGAHCYANPVPVVDRESGRITLFYADNYNNASTRLLYIQSIDNGGTWSAPVDVTALFDDDEYARPFHLPGPGHGIQLTKGPNAGRLLLEVWHRHTVNYPVAEREYGASLLYSDDGGLTWQAGGYMAVGHNMNEARIAEASNGDVYINSRTQSTNRIQVVSTDGGITWGQPAVWSSIGSYGACDSGFFTFEANGISRMLISHIAGTTRNNTQVRISYDDGEGWSEPKELYRQAVGTNVGYSEITLMGGGMLGVLHPQEDGIYFTAFNLEWLTDGADSYSRVADVDKTGLRHWYLVYRAITNEDGAFTPESYAALQEALDEALRVLEAGTSTAEDVTLALAGLHTAYEGLTPATGSTMEELQTLYTATLLLDDPALYTHSSWLAFDAARASAGLLLQAGDAPSGTIQATYNALAEAMAALVDRGDTSLLAVKVMLVAARYEGREDFYTAASWNRLVLAIREADTLCAAPLEAGAAAVAAAAAELDAAEAALVPQNKAGLRYWAGVAYGLLLESDRYIPSAIEELAAAYSDALRILEEPEAQQAEIDAAEQRLYEAVVATLQLGDKTALQQLVDMLTGYLQEDGYTPASWAVYAAVLVEAGRVLAMPDAIETEITAAHGTLLEAVEGLIPLPDKTDLLRSIERAEAVLADAGAYAPASLEGLQAALDAAQVMAAGEETTQAQVNEAWRALNERLAAVRLKAKKEALRASMRMASTIDLAPYTEESANALRGALDHAAGILTNEDATQQSVDTAKQQVDSAVAGLAKQPVPPPVVPPLPETKLPIPTRPAATAGTGTAGAGTPAAQLPDTGTQEPATTILPESPETTPAPIPAQPVPLANLQQESNGPNTLLILLTGIGIGAATVGLAAGWKLRQRRKRENSHKG